MSIYDAAMHYKAEGMPLVVFAGKEYGTGSSRDWAAKGTKLLGVRAVIAETFERIHRSNLVGMGVLPLQFKDGQSWQRLGLTGDETVTIRGLTALKPRQKLAVSITSADGKTQDIEVLCRIDTEEELTTTRTAASCRSCCATWRALPEVNRSADERFGAARNCETGSPRLTHS